MVPKWKHVTACRPEIEKPRWAWVRADAAFRAWQFVPCTEQQLEEAPSEVTDQNILALRSDKPAVEKALQTLARRLRPHLATRPRISALMQEVQNYDARKRSRPGNLVTLDIRSREDRNSLTLYQQPSCLEARQQPRSFGANKVAVCKNDAGGTAPGKERFRIVRMWPTSAPNTVWESTRAT